jgi:formamidopyrimidine-DNA glycosylase
MCRGQVQLELEGGVQAAFCDPRRFGRVKQSADVAAELAHLGFDPLLSMPPAADLAERLGKERRAIKALLLDQARPPGGGGCCCERTGCDWHQQRAQQQ